MAENCKLALLIDAENISPKYIKTIFDELSKYGVHTDGGMVPPRGIEPLIQP